MQLQWSLEHTVNSTLSVARGIIEAATKDNVQALALLACERFGATLAICPETCRKVEDLVIKTRPPAVIGFLSAVVGYSSNDCASELVRSLAGVQFFGLAASLVTSIGPFQGGNALEAMLAGSAVDKTLLPTARQLKDLLASLEHRCVGSGFADSVLGYQILLTKSRSLSDAQARDLWRGSALYPEPVGIAMLVDAFRQLSRIGDAQQITIKATACAPWVVAFTKWCLGHPPSIYFNDGSPLLQQSAVKVTIIVFREISGHSGIEIAVHREVDTPAELIRAREALEPYSGMISIENYGRWLFREYELASETGWKAIRQALPYALKQIITHFLSSSDAAIHSLTTRPTTSSAAFKAPPKKSEELLGLATSPFAPDSVISKMVARLLGLEQPPPLPSLREDLLIEHLPLVELYLRDAKEQCPCSKCTLSSDNSFPGCFVSRFFTTLAFIVTDIIALSLFDNSESLLVYMNHKRRSQYTGDQTTVAISKILRSGRTGQESLTGFLNWALILIGHKCEDMYSHEWVISSFQGQAVFPKLFETQVLKKRGYLTLSWAPGVLLHEGNIYTRGLYGRFEPTTNALPLLGAPKEVTEPINLVPSLKPVWRVTPSDLYLKIDLGLDSSLDNNLSFINTSAHQILHSMSMALVLESCPHDPSAALSQPDPFCEYSGPLIPYTESEWNGDPTSVQVVAVAGSCSLRMFTLSSIQSKAVLRGNACLSCCLDVCRRFDYKVIVC